VGNAGFTGTRNGMSAAQKRALEDLLVGRSVRHLHHGDCTGADAEAHDVAIRLYVIPVIHPPTDPTRRAFKSAPASHLREPLPYLERNHAIVNESDFLIAAPDGPETLRSGTWATVRYARKVGKRVLVIMPNGEILP